MIAVASLFEQSWDLFKKGFWRILGIVGLTWLMLLAVGVASIALIGATVFSKISSLPMFGSGIKLSSFTSIAQVIAPLGINLIIILLLFLAGIIISVWGKLAELVAIRDLGQGQEIEIKQCFKEAWTLVEKYLWLAFLSGLAMSLGFILLVIPGILLWVWFSLIFYVLVWEKTKGIAAIKRSKNLVQGNWWAVFGRMLLIMLVLMLVNTIAGLISPVLMLIAVFSGIFSLIYSAVIYKDLRDSQSGEVA